MPAYQKEKPKTIKAMFNDIAQQYDITNRVISFNMYKGWNRQLAKQATKSCKKAFSLLDLCAGTGEVAFECLKKSPHSNKAYLLDFSHEMLNIAKKKAAKLPFKQHQLEYLEADAQKIPLDSHSIDCATIAYGIRNVKDPTKCFQEVYRVLKPGGNFAILELTRPNNRFLKFGHQLYMRIVMPLFGKLLTRNKQAYQYLCNSVHAFISPKEIEEMLKEKGFKKVKSIPLAGGIATIIVANKS
jgi:demethylmenaquinone methyltransferase/2-methoxy-6-polyprenyl-1,4-benzoquinol methylase